MASPGHTFGQIVGDTLELALKPPLAAFAAEHGLYLDAKGPRRARPGVKVTWEDGLGNRHDLDYVLERGGTDDEIGIPAAFIEVAWRRYTKHSKNKAQEIEAAVLPIAAHWSHVRPFVGAVLAGEFTARSLDQLRSNGFVVLHIPYATILEAFLEQGVDAFYEERTSDAYRTAQIARYRALSDAQRRSMGDRVRERASGAIEEFVAALQSATLRRIDSISILPLYGSTIASNGLESAIELLRAYRPAADPGALVRFEITVRYDNGDRVVADFASAADAIAFLESFR